MSRWSSRLFREYREGAPDRPDDAVALAAVFFLFTGAAYVFKAVKISLFLKWLGASKLPFAYLITAVAMGFVVTLNARWLRTLRRRPYLLGSLAFFALTLVLFRFFLAGHRRGLLVLYWLWSDVFLALSVTQFWIVVGDTFHPRQARRLVGAFVKAGLLGGIFGSFLVSRLAGLLGTENMLAFALAFLLAAMGLADGVLRKPLAASREGPTERPREEGRAGYAQGFRAVIKSRYLVLLSLGTIAAIAASTLLDWQFSAILDFKIPVADARTVFLGTFQTGLLAFSFLMQAALTPRVLRVFGLRAAVLVTPAVLLLGVAAAAAIPAAAALPWIVAVKGADKSLTHTFSQSTRELLYLPVPAGTRAQAKPFIDMFLNKLGDGTAALLIAGLGPLFAVPWRGMSLVTGIVLALLVIITLGLMREYGSVVKGNLRLRRPDAGRVVEERLDVDAAKLVFDTLESRGRSSTLYAMNLMDLLRQDRMSPGLRGILNEGAARSRGGAFDTLLDAGGEPFFPDWDGVLEENDVDDQVREVLSLDVYRQLMERRFERWSARPDGDFVSGMEAAKAIGMMPPDSFLIGHLRRLLLHPSSEVLLYALDSAAKHPRPEFAPLIVPHLAHPALADAAGRALRAYGGGIIGMLGDVLNDAAADSSVRKAVPAVLARAATPRAAAVLMRALSRRDPEVRTEILDALVRIRTELPNLRFSEKEVRTEVLFAVAEACVLVERVAGAQREAAAEAQAALLPQFKGIFDLLGLLYPQDDIVRAWQNYERGERRAVDHSIDLLEHLLRREDKDLVLPLLEEAPLAEKARRCREMRRSIRGARL